MVFLFDTNHVFFEMSLISMFKAVLQKLRN